MTARRVLRALGMALLAAVAIGALIGGTVAVLAWLEAGL